MCPTPFPETAMKMNMMENKQKFVKAVMNIIQKLKMASGLKKEKYLCRVRKEFNLAKDEKWVITKLRMMLVRLDVGMELLQIRKSQNIKKEMTNLGVRESTRNNILYNAQKAIRENSNHVIKENERKEAIASSRSSKCDQKKQQQPKHTKTARRI